MAKNDNQVDAITNPTGAVVVQKVAATLSEPAMAVTWTKQQAVNYQYIQWWEFNADGSIDGASVRVRRISDGAPGLSGRHSDRSLSDDARFPRCEPNPAGVRIERDEERLRLNA